MIKSLLALRMRSALSGVGKLTKKAKSANPTKARKIASIALFSLICALLVASVEFIFVGMAVIIAPTLIAAGADWFYFLLFICIDVTLVFILGVFTAKSEIFECKDNELLLSMPIRPRDIVISRILSVIIWNYLSTALFFIPAIIVYAVFGGSYLGVIGSSVVLLFLPLLPTAISALVGYAVSLLTAKFKNKTLITVIFFFAFFALYMVGYTALVSGMENMLLAVGGAAERVGRFAFLRAIGDAAVLKPLPLVLLCLTALLSLALTVVAISLGFSKIVSGVRGGKKVVYRAKKHSGRPPVFALVRKELTRFFTSSTYIINDSLGVIFALVAAIYVIVKRDMIVPLAAAFASLVGVGNEVIITAALPAVIGLCASMSFISSCSLSLEGKSFPLLKSLPVTAKQVLLAKTLSHLIITAPVVLVSSVLMCIGAGQYSYIWFYILAPQILNAACALFGIIFDTAFPNFDYKNEVVVIKQSISVFLTLLASVLFTVAQAAMLLALARVLPAPLATALTLTACAVVLLSLIWVLLKFSTKRYENL